MIVVLATPFGRAAPAPAADEIVLGVLLSLTGDWSSLGNDSQAAIELAVDEVNRTLLAGSPTRLRAVVEDTRLQPDVALDRLRSLAAQGARIVIGPQSSAEVRALKPFADANGVLLVSQGSTASALAIPDDNIFRFVPDDSHEIDALVALLVADGIQTIVPMWRDDTGNQGLEASLRRTFPRAGGTVASGVSYPADRVQFAGALASLSAQVAQAVAERGPDAVGVYLAAFDEAASVLATAQRDPGLASVRWYGSDGAALSDALVSDPDAARFAVRAGYPNPTVGLDQQARDRWQPVASQIRARTGTDPDPFGLAAYDATWVAALTLLSTGGTTDAAVLRTALTRIADSYDGVTGPVRLNLAGDRAEGNYDFWAVRERPGGGYQWRRVARYELGPGSSFQLIREE